MQNKAWISPLTIYPGPPGKSSLSHLHTNTKNLQPSAAQCVDVIVKSRVLSHRNISWKCCSWQGASAQVEEPTDAQIKSFHFKITKITTLAQLSFLLTPLLRELDNNLDTQKFKSLGVQVDHYQWIWQINNMLIFHKLGLCLMTCEADLLLE